uniref:glycosyltransferase n=1 Tax=Candidatus Pelagibacter sp. HIMB1521 TaxID=3413344 RepID=UPI003F82AB71
MTNFFSIIVPVLNQVKYIDECLLSILNQKYKNYEIIIIDGKSNDGTLKKIKKLQKKNKKKIKLIINSKLSQAAAINLGIKLSKGQWITWQNGDDFYTSKNSFNYLNDSINKNNKKKLHLGNMLIVDKNSTKISKLIYSTPNFYSLLYEGMTLSNQSLIWHKDINKKIGYLIDTRVNFDYEWFLRVLKNFPDTCVHFNKLVGSYRIHDGQKTFKKNSKELMQIKKIKF